MARKAGKTGSDEKAVEVPVERIERSIHLIRGQKVLLDRDLADLYGLETRVLNQAVSRNIDRFPSDFMFALTREEIMRISQTVISSKIKYAKRVYMPLQSKVWPCCPVCCELSVRCRSTSRL